jgi:gamma-glutamyltranspeptidase / glutathione hydrolase
MIAAHEEMRTKGDEMAERSEWIVDRTEATSQKGMVAAKTGLAADAGATALKRGGNAIDAAVTAGLTAWVVEPWMNGIGGGGFLVAHFPERIESVVVEFPMISAAGATPEMFKLVGTGTDDALFGWPAVVGNANVVGHKAAAVPGAVAGLALALERFGTISFAEALEPAIQYAEEGFPIEWNASHYIARDLANLSRFPATASVFLDSSGNPPFSLEGSPSSLRQPDLARSLRTLAAEGPRAFYEGDIARRIVDHLVENGAPFTFDDFSIYEARVSKPISASYKSHQVLTIGGGTGGTTLAQSITLLDQAPFGSLGHNSTIALHNMAQAFRLAFADRFTYLADPEVVEVPLEAMLSAGYLAERLALIQNGSLNGVCAGNREQLGIRHNLRGSMPEYTAGGCTTHIGAIDATGNSVSLTQTLLSGWGSRVVVPGTGVLLNNGMMWFDPVPGRPNSVGGRKRPLSNMSPALVIRDGRPVATLGASGGRRILNCVAQLVFNLVDHGMNMQPAVNAPRIDASTPELLLSNRLAPETQDALRQLGHNVVARDEQDFYGDFASPACVQFDGSGTYRGGVDPYYRPATATGF